MTMASQARTRTRRAVLGGVGLAFAGALLLPGTANAQEDPHAGHDTGGTGGTDSGGTGGGGGGGSDSGGAPRGGVETGFGGAADPSLPGPVGLGVIAVAGFVAAGAAARAAARARP